MVIPDLEHELSTRFRHSDGGGVESLADALAAIARPDVLLSLLDELLSSRGLLDEVASRSVWHPNGFSKIILLAQPSYKLRLHVWHQARDIPGETRGNIHNHRWDFAMALLAGSYRHQEFRPSRSDDGREFYSYAYMSEPDGSSYSLTPAGTKPLRCVFDARLFPGSAYTIASDVIHRVVPVPGRPPVSLVLEGPTKPSSVEVFTVEQIAQASTAPFNRLSAEHLISSMNTVMALPTLEAS